MGSRLNPDCLDEVRRDFRRNFRHKKYVQDGLQGFVIAKIKTTWYLLDLKTKRPKRIEADLANIFL